MKTLIKLLMFIALSVTLSSQNIFASEKIKIGLIVPLSGENSLIGGKIIKSMRMAINKINDERAFFETLAESSLLKTLDGSCRSPISASAHFTDSKELILYGAIATLDGTKVIRSKIKGSIKDAIKLGKELGNKIKAQTNGDFLFK